MSIDDSSEKEFAIRKSYRGDGKKRYETVLALNIFIFILTSNHIKKSTQLLFLLKSLFISTHETRALPTCKKSNKHFCYCIIARMFSASSFLANGAQHPFVSLSSSFRCLSSSSSTTRKNAHQSHLLFARKSASPFRKVRIMHQHRAQTTRTSFYFCRERALAKRSLAGRFCNNHLKINSQKKRFVPFQTTKNRREVNTRKIERLRMTRLY